MSDLINDESSDLRSFGTSYMIEGMEQFFEDHLTSTKDAKGEENPRGLVNEHATYLYKDDGEVRIGPEDFEGYPGRVTWGKGGRQDSEGRFSDARLHTHPDVGKISADGRGIYQDGVSTIDGRHVGKNGGGQTRYKTCKETY